MDHWTPKSIVALQHYDRHTFLSDAIAGVTVGLVALPLAIAFAIASGLPPQAGIYCAIVAGFLTSALGGSMTAIGGPTGAFAVVVAGIIGQYGVNGLFLCTMMAGVTLIASDCASRRCPTTSSSACASWCRTSRRFHGPQPRSVSRRL